MEIKKLEYQDLSITFVEQPNGTLNQTLVFSDNALEKNPHLFKKLSSGLSPTDNFIYQIDTNSILIPSLSPRILYRHYLYQIVDLVESNQLLLDLQHVNPLTHQEALSFIRSTRLSHERKKTIDSLKQSLNVLSFGK